MANTPDFVFPARSDRHAPLFVASSPTSLTRFFEDLEELYRKYDAAKRLQNAANPTLITEQEKKKQAVNYLDSETHLMWMSLTEYTTVTSTWEQFKTQVYKMYPGSNLSDSRAFTVADMNSLIGNWALQGISSKEALGNFYRPYFTITSKLLQHNIISMIDQTRGFFTVFNGNPDLARQIQGWIERNIPTYFPGDPVPLDRLYEAAIWCLSGSGVLSGITSIAGLDTRTAPTIPYVHGQGGFPALAPVPHIPIPTSYPPQNYYPPAGYHPPVPPAYPPAPPPVVVPEATVTIKQEPTEMALLVKQMQEMVKVLIQNAKPTANNNGKSTAGPSRQPDEFNRQQGSNLCAYCGREGCRIRTCEIAKKDVEAGWCKRDETGKIVLPNGGWIGRGFEGNTMRERLQSYHRMNPGHNTIATPSNPTGRKASSMPPLPGALWNLSFTQEDESDNESLAELQLRLQILQLQRNQTGFEGVALRKQPMRKARKAHESTERQTQEMPVENVPAQRRDGGIRDEGRTSQVPPLAQIIKKIQEPVKADLPEKVEPVPATRGQVPTKVPIVPLPRGDKNVRSQLPMHDNQAAQRVLEEIMETPVLLTARDIMVVSSEVSKLMREMNTPRKVNVETQPNPRPRPGIIPGHLVVFGKENKPLTSMPCNLNTNLPPTTTVINDPILAYYHATGELPDGTIVGHATEPIRAVRPTIAGLREVEAIIDSGCSLVSMSDRICRELALLYDPSIKIPLQSANGQVDETLGLAPNVPFMFGEITLYMQVHIVRDPPFDVLLGRPFERLTVMESKTYADGSQGLTLTDPNTDIQVTVPTFDRNDPLHGEPRLCPHHRRLRDKESRRNHGHLCDCPDFQTPKVD